MDKLQHFQLLNAPADPGLPSEHNSLFWGPALAALTTRRHAVPGFPLLAAGLLVGGCRVGLGVHFPYGLPGARPVATLGTAAAVGLRHPHGPGA